MLGVMYPFWAAVTANVTAQLLKPIFYYFRSKQWQWRWVIESGGFPSSHTSTVTALAGAVGIQEQFHSTIFAVTLTFALIVAYDAANVRYYAGQNIRITQQLIKDFQALTQLKLDDPIYLLKIKEVLGHRWIEVFGGFILGIMVALLLLLIK